MAELSRKTKKLELALKANGDDSMLRACESYLNYIDAEEGSRDEKTALEEWIRLDPNRFAETIVKRLDETEVHLSENAEVMQLVDWATEGAARGAL
jgi:hypothetical protein